MCIRDRNRTALQSPAAYATWLALAAFSTAALLGVLLTPERSGVTPTAWYLAPVLWLLFAVPGAVLLHGHALSATGDTTAPEPANDTALAAARSIWGVLAFGVLLSLVTARVAGEVSPSVWPGAVMFMLLILARPGRAA